MKDDTEEIPVEVIAQAAYAVHCVLQEWLEDPCPSQPWHTLTPDRKELDSDTVRLIQRGFPYEYVHQIWVDKMAEDGWAPGAVKDPARKRHPCMVRWDKLPFWEQQKLVMAFHIVQGATSRGR